ncbi:MAG: TIGR03915 family putative DNA repair protein [Angelakisella sp.]
MPDRTAVTPALRYLYDDTLAGLLCCVYESYTRREQVLDICPAQTAPLSLYPTRLVETDEAHARRVYDSLAVKLGGEGQELVVTAFAHCDQARALTLFQFIAMGYRCGARVCRMLGDPVVSSVHKMHDAVLRERHLLLGFVRFSECPPERGLALPGDKNVLAAVIEPKHRVLPMLAEHFCNRFPEERFFIYDKTHRLALVYQPYQPTLVELDAFELPQGDDSEQLYQRLWQGYYDAIAIAQRANPRCRRNLVPKRFWPNMTELKGQV